MTPLERAWELELQLDQGEALNGLGQMNMPIELVTGSATVRLDLPIEPTHPDLLALAALTTVAPWCRRGLTLSNGISSHLAEIAKTGLGIRVGPIDDSLTRRTLGATTGLMNSGGPDCMAAELLVGLPTVSFHFRRVKHPRVPDRTRLKAALQEAIVRGANETGVNVKVAASNLEFLCRPYPTFPHWTALTIGAILSADQQDLGGLITGRNLSGIYLTWGKKFNPNGEQEEVWRRLFSAVGIELLQPLAGATDVVSKRIARGHPLYGRARSCLVGTPDGPCHACKKCLISDLIEAAESGRGLPPELDRSLWSSARVRQAIETGPPFANQHLLSYAVGRIPHDESVVMDTLASSLQAKAYETSWVGRYYMPALGSHVPATLQDNVRTTIASYCEPMDLLDIQRLESWDVSPKTIDAPAP